MLVLLHPEQAAQVALLSRDLELSEAEVVRHLLSGPLLPLDPADYAAMTNEKGTP